MNNNRFGAINYSATADFDLLHKAYTIGHKKGYPVSVGNIFTSDRFYNSNAAQPVKLLTDYGILVVDMETCELYTLSAQFRTRAWTLLTVRDSFVTKEAATAEERQTSYLVFIWVSPE